jgi:hypothetical protein
VLVLLLTTGVAAAEPTLTVVEDLGVGRTAWPITTGFPFPKGMVRDAARIYVEDAAGVNLAVQARPLAAWPDGSIRWAQLDLAVDLGARQVRELRVRTGTPPHHEQRLLVEDKDDAVRIDTGRLRFAVPKNKAALIEDVYVDGEKLSTEAITSFMRFSAQRAPARAPKAVRLAEKGALRARVELEGDYGAGFRYIIRIDAFAGQPFVRILHTFENHGDEKYTAIREIGIEVPMQLAAGTAYEIGINGRTSLKAKVPERGAKLVQLDNETLVRDGEESKARAAGWTRLTDGKRSVIVAARYFWQEYPQGFQIRRDGVLYNLWSPDALPAVAGMGAAKTHEVVIVFSGAKAAKVIDPETLITPLIAAPDSEWIRDSGALSQAIASSSAAAGNFLAGLRKSNERYERTKALDRWDDSGHVTCAQGERETPRIGAFGMWNWGDWNFPGYHDDVKGCDAWGNLEYDLTQVLALGFAATGDKRLHDGMVAAARHYMDVDLIYHQRQRPEWVGMNHPKNPLHFTFEMGGVDLGHTWNEGLLSYYYLTGDERGRAAALGIADYLTRRIDSGGIRGNPRQWGWPQIALVAAYEATLERRYLAAAESYARGGMRAHPPQPEHWKVGIFAETLTYTHAATDDRELETELETWLRKYASAALEAKVRDPRFFPAIAYVAKLTGDADGLAAARSAATNIRFGAWGKPLTLGGRIGFRILSLTSITPSR